MFAERAEGALVQDLDGNVFVDFAGGIGILNAGHCPPEVVEVLKTQIDPYLLRDISFYGTVVRLAERLAQIAPGILPKGNAGHSGPRLWNAVNIAASLQAVPDYRFGMRLQADLHGQI